MSGQRLRRARRAMETAERWGLGASEGARRRRLLPADPAASGYSAPAPPRAPPAALPPAPPRLLPAALRPHSSRAPLGCRRARGSALTSPLRALCSPPRRSAGFWRPWVDARAEEEEEEAPHHAAEAVSEPRGAGRAPRAQMPDGAGDVGPEGDARPACPSLKIAPAGGPVGAHAASVSSRAAGTYGSDRERGC